MVVVLLVVVVSVYDVGDVVRRQVIWEAFVMRTGVDVGWSGRV